MRDIENVCYVSQYKIQHIHKYVDTYKRSTSKSVEGISYFFSGDLQRKQTIKKTLKKHKKM